MTAAEICGFTAHSDDSLSSRDSHASAAKAPFRADVRNNSTDREGANTVTKRARNIELRKIFYRYTFVFVVICESCNPQS